MDPKHTQLKGAAEAEGKGKEWATGFQLKVVGFPEGHRFCPVWGSLTSWDGTPFTRKSPWLCVWISALQSWLCWSWNQSRVLLSSCLAEWGLLGPQRPSQTAVLGAVGFQCPLPQPWWYLAYSECSINVCGKWEELSSLFPGMDLHPEEQGLWSKELKMWFFPMFLLNSVKLSFPIISAIEDVETNYDTYVWNISSLKYLGPRKFQIWEVFATKMAPWVKAVAAKPDDLEPMGLKGRTDC